MNLLVMWKTNLWSSSGSPLTRSGSESLQSLSWCSSGSIWASKLWTNSFTYSIACSLALWCAQALHLLARRPRSGSGSESESFELPVSPPPPPAAAPLGPPHPAPPLPPPAAAPNSPLPLSLPPLPLGAPLPRPAGLPSYPSAPRPSSPTPISPSPASSPASSYPHDAIILL